MAGSITLERSEGDGVAFLTLSNPAKLNAIDIAMWRELHALMLHLQALPPEDAPHAVIVRGAAGQFASGGDIVEFANLSADAMQSISLATVQQQAGSDQLVAAMEDINRSTRKNVESAKEMASTQTGLVTLSKELEQVVDTFGGRS